MYSEWLYDWYREEVESSPLDRSVELKKKKHLDFKKQIIEETSWLDEGLSKNENIRIGLRLKCVLENITEMPSCRVCGRTVKGARKAEFNATCGSKSCKDKTLVGGHLEYKTQHGHPMRNEEIKKKAVSNLRKFFKSDKYLDNREWYINQKKREAIPKKRFDHNGQLLIGDMEWYVFDPATLSREARLTISNIRNGRITRRNESLASFIRAKERKNVFGKYANQDKAYTEEQLELLNNKDWVYEIYHSCGSIREASNQSGISYKGIQTAMKFHDIKPLKKHKSSSYEKKLSRILTSMGIDHVMNSKKLIGSEIDLFIPSMNLAVEINGMYWHSKKFKDPLDHQKKALECLNSNFSFYVIWESDVFNKDDGYESFLKFLGTYEDRKGENIEDKISLDRIWVKDFSPDWQIFPPKEYEISRRRNIISMNEISSSPDNIPPEKRIFDCGYIKKPLN